MNFTRPPLFLCPALAAGALWFLSGCGTLIPAQRHPAAIAEAAGRNAGVTPNTLSDAGVPGPATNSLQTLRLDAAEVLRLAFRHSRSLQTLRESLATAALDLLEQRRAFGPQVTGEVAGRLDFAGDSKGASPTGAVGFSDILPSAATFKVDASSLQTPGREGGDWDSRVKARIEQPLLAGAGYEASHEALIQAEHDLVQRLRQFELDRQDLAIEVLDAYYKLVSLRAQLDNARTALERSQFSLRRSEAMFKVQLAPYIDVARSQQQEISSRRRLEDAQLRHDSAVKRILLLLGIDPSTPVDIVADTPMVIPLLATADDCETAALDRRLDLRNALDRVGDAARRLRIARGNRWPDLALFAEAGRSGQGDAAFSQVEPEDTAAVGLALKIDPDRRDQRDAVERARILLQASERQAAQTRDEARVEVFEETERLLTARSQVALSAENLRIARRRYENATLRFESGELGNRDVVEAENGLLDARNTLVDTAIGHENARIRLLARIGLLDIGTEGALLDATGTSVPPNLFGPPEPLPLQP